MKITGILGLVIAVLLIAPPGPAQTRETEIQAIESLIQRAYIGGAYNDEKDTKAMAGSFHESFFIHRVHDEEIGALSLGQLRTELDTWKSSRKNWNNRTSGKVEVLALEGNAAVARVDVALNGERAFIAFLSLLKSKDGWKIVHLANYAPPITFATHRVSTEAWERDINARQPPERVMDAMGLKPGMVAGEIGAGHGRYTIHLAARVGERGKVLANDINDAALAFLEERCRATGIRNVEIIHGRVDHPLFPDGSLDMAVMVWVYHMLERPDELLKNLRPSLKPGAPLVILDPVDSEIDVEFGVDRSRPGVQAPTLKQRIEKSAAAAGFELVRIETFLPLDRIYILRAK